MRPKVGVIFTQSGKRRPSPFVGDLYQQYKDRGEENARSIAGADDPRNFKINVEDHLGVSG